MDATNHLAMTLFNYAFSVETVGALTRKGIFTSTEANEIFDRVLLNFETQAGMATPDLLPAITVGRKICEAALAQLSAQGRTP
jgi:hypothetical protein